MKSKRNPRKSVKKSAIKPDSPRKLFPGLSENQARFKSIACQKVQSEGITGDLDMGLLDVGEFSVKEIADDICAMLSDEHLRALLSVKDFDCESAYSLLTNLHSYWNRRGKKNELQPFRESIFQNLTILAKAIKAGKSECLGRTINSWLKTWTATGCGEKNLYWAERRAKTLANDPLFKSGLESVFKIWPEELSTFHNVFIPNWEGGVINLETASIIEQHEAIDLWRNAVDCSEEFLRIARQFVLDWNLSYLQFSTSDCFGFERNEIIDPLSFKKKLTQSSDGVSAFLRENMPAETSRAMDNFPRLSPLLYAYYLTSVIEGQAVYNTQRFTGVKLSSETQQLLLQNPQRKELVHLNRMLLEDAYPQELSRNQRLPLQFAPAQIHCASDINSQGVYVFIPRYYNWSRIKNDTGDFAHVREMLDNTFEKFSPPKGDTHTELVEECRRYVVAKLNGKEMTAALIQKHVLHWSWQMVKKRDDTEPQIRHTSLDTPARYYREVRKLLMGK